MSRNLTSALICIAFCFGILLQPAHADIPKMISYQGRVTDGGGATVADGTCDMAFKLFDAVTGGTQEWESGTVSITVTDGVFTTLLGEAPQIPILLHFTEDLWLEVVFDGVTQSPRHRMASVGYAYMASGLVPGTQMHESMLGELLHVHNQRSSGSANGVEARTYSSSGYALIGIAEATQV